MEIALTKQINIEISPLIVRANSLRRLLPQVTTNQTYKTFARNLKKRKKRIFMKIVVVTTKHWTSPLMYSTLIFFIGLLHRRQTEDTAITAVGNRDHQCHLYVVVIYFLVESLFSSSSSLLLTSDEE